MIDSVKELIDPYVEKDPTKFCTCEEFEAGVSTLKEFCLFRAQSVCGQLDGTIASTSDGQAQDKSSLVDAGDLEISDMGTMGNNMAQGGGPENGMENNMMQDGGPENGMPMQGERRAVDFDQENIPVAVNGKNIQGTDAGNDGEKWILLGISAGVLLVGLVIAGTFKR